MTEMKTLLAAWPGATVVRHDAATGAWIFIALHRLDRGMASGGTRMKIYDCPEDGLVDAMRLAEGMSSKWAAIDFPFGGGKAVLALSRPVVGVEREGLLRRYGRLVESLRGAFGTGADLGTSPVDIRTMGEECRYVHGYDRVTGAITDPGPYTARGVFAGLRVAVREVFGSDDLHGRTVLVQGVGSVGGPLARFVRDAGGTVLVTDADDALAAKVAAELGGRAVSAAEAMTTPCDVLAPCAIGGILDAATIAGLRCRVVAGSANNQLARREDASALHARGILYAPDYVINAGGAISLSLPTLGVEESEAILRRVERIGDTLGEIFAEARTRNESPLDAAERRVARVLGETTPELAPAAR